MDRMGANFLKVVGQIKLVWALTLFLCSWLSAQKTNSPALSTGEDEGDQLERRRRRRTFEYEDVPADMMELAEEWRQNLIESAAEASEELMENTWAAKS